MGRKPKAFTPTAGNDAAQPQTALSGHAIAEGVDDREAAAIRAQALRAGGRRAANERTPRLDYPKRPGWHQCWINDIPGNIERYMERGYDFRIDPVTKERISRAVGTREQGGAQIGFLMEIPLEIYNEDCKALEAEMDKIDRDIRRGEVDGKLTEQGLHVPTDTDGTPRLQIKPAR